MSRHTPLPTLPLDFTHGTSSDISKQNSANEKWLDFKRTFIFLEFTAVNGQKNIAFPHLSNIYTCTYMYYLHWDAGRMNKIREICFQS